MQIKFEDDAGKVRTIMAPDNIRTREDAQAYIDLYKQAESYAGGRIDDMGFGRKFMLGMMSSAERGAAGLAGMFTDLHPAHQEKLDEAEAFAEVAGDAATAGNVTGDVLKFVSPGNAAMKATQGMKVLPRFAALTGADAATAASMAPDGERTAEALWAAGGSAGADLAAKGVKRLIGGPLAGQTTREASELMQDGVPVPAWKGTDPDTVAGRVTRGVAERARAMPLTGAVVSNMEDDALRAWNKEFLKTATPPGAKPVDALGPDAVAELSDKFNRAYSNIYKGHSISTEVLDRANKELGLVIDTVERELPNYADEMRGAWAQTNRALKAGRNLQPHQGRISPHLPELEGATPSSLTDAIRVIEKRIGSAFRQGKGDLADAYGTVLEVLQEARVAGLPPEVQKEAAEVNSAYRNFRQYQRAMTNMGPQKAGMAAPGDMMRAIKAEDRSAGKAAFARGRAAPNQAQVAAAEQVLGSNLPAVGPGTAEKLIGSSMFAPVVGAPLVLGDAGLGLALMGAAGTETGQRYLQGGYGFQRPMRDIFDSERVRQFGRSLAAGGFTE